MLKKLLLLVFEVVSLKSPKYPYDPRIHNFGNVGLGGKIHAQLARPFTKLIDIVAYNGINIRESIVSSFNYNGDVVSDWCCGTGTSTDALQTHYTNAHITSFDTSKEMISVAKECCSNDIDFYICDVEDITLIERANLITIMFAFHEIPQEGRLNILKNAYNNLVEGGVLLIVDIDLSYTPSSQMRSGEPFIDDYLENVESDFVRMFDSFEKNIHVPGHVCSWTMTRTSPK